MSKTRRASHIAGPIKKKILEEARADVSAHRLAERPISKASQSFSASFPVTGSRHSPSEAHFLFPSPATRRTTWREFILPSADCNLAQPDPRLVERFSYTLNLAAARASSLHDSSECDALGNLGRKLQWAATKVGGRKVEYHWMYRRPGPGFWTTGKLVLVGTNYCKVDQTKALGLGAYPSCLDRGGRPASKQPSDPRV